MRTGRGHIKKIRLKNGRTKFLVVLYAGRVGPKEKRIWRRFDLLKDAQVFASESTTTLAKGGTLPVNTKQTLQEFFEDWLEGYKGGLSPTTARSYEDQCKLHLFPALGHVRLTALSPALLQRYISDKLADGLAPTTVQHHLRLLHRGLEHALRWGLVSRNVCDLVDAPKRQSPEMQVWDEEQLRVFLGAARRSSRYYVLYHFAAVTGCRQGEVCGLRWKDVDFIRRTATINQTLYRLAGQLIVKPPKTKASRRPLSLPDPLLQELRDLKKERDRNKELSGSQYGDMDLVFCQANGRPLHATDFVKRDFKKIIKDAKLPMIRFHDLRHTALSIMAKHNVHPKTLQAIAGHASAAFTLSVYGHVLGGMQETAIDGLEQSLFANKGQGEGDTGPTSW